MEQPIWVPQCPQQTNMWQFLRFVEEKYQLSLNDDYHQLHTWSIQHLALFWQALVAYCHITFDTPAHTILTQEKDMRHTKWFEGARFNFAEKLLSRRDAHLALIAVNEQGQRQTMTYQALYQEVAEIAQGLKACGIQPGDRVAGILPNIKETVVAMLATTTIGAIWSSCSPDFGEQSLIDRLGQITPKLLFTVDEQHYHGKTFDILSKINHVQAAIPSIKHTVLIRHNVLAPKPPDVILWNTLKQPTTTLPSIAMPFDHPVYILFSSGTTGKPKCITHGAGGTLLQHIKELALHSDLKSHDNLCFYTTCGWMMWNWMVSGLALGATLTLYEGSPTYPDIGRLFHLIETENITIFGTSAKFISSVEKAMYQPMAHHHLSHLRCILSTGSPLLPSHYDFVYQQVKKDVQLSSISGGTDIISCFALGNPMLPVYKGELQCLGLGLSVSVYNEQGKPVVGERGELVCTQPFPAQPVCFWNDPNNTRYQQAYFEKFPGVWAHGDYAELTQHHGLIIYGRSDATLNPGGVRIGTAEIYRQVEKIPQILESIAIAQPIADDVRIVLFVKLRDHVLLDELLRKTIKDMIRYHASPRHVPEKIIQVSDIPRTLSGKIVEIAVRQAVMNEPIQNIDSLANPESLHEYRNREELCE